MSEALLILLIWATPEQQQITFASSAVYPSMEACESARDELYEYIPVNETAEYVCIAKNKT